MEESIIISNEIPKVDLPFGKEESNKSSLEVRTEPKLNLSFPSFKNNSLLLSLNLSTITESGSQIPKIKDKKAIDPSTFKAEVTYPDGSKYSGYVGKAMRRHGFGTLRWKNGAIYTGEFSNDMCHGKGMYRFNDVFYNGHLIENLPDGYGDLSIGNYHYEGKFFDGLKFGKGREQMENGDVYVGMFDDGRRMGKGVLSDKDGKLVREGIFDEESGNDFELKIQKIVYPKTDEFGRLKERPKDGENGEEEKPKVVKERKDCVLDSKYIGEIDENDMKSGQGIKKFEEGSPYSKYEGQWSNNKFQGYGILTYKNGEVYKGEFNSGQFHGNGVFNYENGNVYKGNWRHGHRSGLGRLTNKNGDVIEGEFNNGLVEGFGYKKMKNGDFYEGEFLKGKINGIGIMKTGEDIYVGGWLNGSKNGFGIELEDHGLGFIMYNNGYLSKKVHQDRFESDQQRNHFIHILRNLFNNVSKKDPFNTKNTKLTQEDKAQLNSLNESLIETNKRLNFEPFSRFLGQIKNSRYHNLGNFWYQEGAQIEGSWLFDLFHGAKGNTIEYRNHDRYEGGFHLGLKHGQFRECYQGVTFCGTYHYGVRTGKGEMVIEDTEVKGSYLFNKIHSKVVFVTEKGNRIYEIEGCNFAQEELSELKEVPFDQKILEKILGKDFSNYSNTILNRTLFASDSNTAEIRFKDSSIYSGGTLLGMRHGKGLIKWEEGSKSYNGDWLYDFPSGYGKLDFGNGNRYIGNFHKGKANGRGVFIYQDGRKVEAIWADDGIKRLISYRWDGGAAERINSSDGSEVYKVSFDNGDSYEGELEGIGKYFGVGMDGVDVKVNARGEFKEVVTFS